MYFKTYGLKYMWMMVMFDLPTNDKEERSKASRFRKTLLDFGFNMAQYSVYVRFTGSRENSEKYVSALTKHNPKTGDISILFFTDYQFGQIIKLYKSNRGEKLAQKPDQFQLF